MVSDKNCFNCPEKFHSAGRFMQATTRIEHVKGVGRYTFSEG